MPQPRRPRPYSELNRNLRTVGLLLKRRLWLKILLGMLLGTGVGLLLSPQGMALASRHWVGDITTWARVPGDLFLAAVQWMITPLVMTSIIIGLNTGAHARWVTRTTLRVLPWFALTTLVAVALGLLLSDWIQPGRDLSPSLLASARHAAQAGQADAQAHASSSHLLRFIPSQLDHTPVSGSIVELVFLALLIGVAILRMPRQRSEPLMALIQAIHEVAMTVVSWLLYLTPIAVFGFLVDVTVRLGPGALLGVTYYLCTVVLGLALVMLMELGLMRWLAGRSIRQVLSRIRDVQILAFTTSSSAATTPLTLEAAIHRLGINWRVARLVIPLGSTLNMNGTAIYQIIATLFLCQLYSLHLGLPLLLLLMLVTVGASIGAPSAPGAGIAILATVLHAVGLPPEGLALLLGVDRLLDMCRSSVNVTGDLVASLVIERWLRRRPSAKPQMETG